MKVMVNVLIGETARNREGVVEIGTATDTVATAAAIAVTAAAIAATAVAIAVMVAAIAVTVAAIAVTVETVATTVDTATDATAANRIETDATDAMVVTTAATEIEGMIAIEEIGIVTVEETMIVIVTVTAEEADATELTASVVATQDHEKIAETGDVVTATPKAVATKNQTAPIRNLTQATAWPT